MKSQKCLTCEFVNFANAEICKRCKRNLHSSAQPKNFRKLSTTCPSCNSSDTQSFEMAYKTGTSFGKVQTTSYNHELGLSVGSANTSHQTVLASNINPPTKPQENEIYFVILALVGSPWLIAMFITANNNDDKIYGFLFGGFCNFLTAIYILFSYKRWSKEINKKRVEYKSTLANWLRSWVCLRCGANWKI